MNPKCKQCKHWKWYNSKQDPEPMHVLSYHYCDVMPPYVAQWVAKNRMKHCEELKLFEKKE